MSDTVAAAEPQGEAAAPTVPVVPAAVPAAAPISAAAVVTPEIVYALALPKDSALDPASVERFTAFAKANGLTPEAAQAVIGRTHDEVAETIKVLEAAIKPGGTHYEAQVKAWAADALAAPDLGNGRPDQLNAVLTEAKLELAKAPPAMREFLENSGFGSHPDAIRWLLAIAARTKEKPLVLGDTGAGKPQERSYADRMYGEPVKT